ncbi:MAG TPA: VIT1/CCC1 transporter family protein [Ilumatobacteraceae bacterium]
MTTIAPRVEDPQRDADDLQREAERVARGGARAAVLGINDGLVSNLALILGVAGASASQGAVRLAGFASLIAGAFSMAAGEWVSVKSQVELAGGVVAEVRRLLQRNPRLILDRLSRELERVGLDTSTSKLASTEMGIEDQRLVDFVARNVLRVEEASAGSPVVAAVTSLLLFSVGALVPLFPWFFTEGAAGVLWSSALTAIAALVVGGWIATTSGRSVAVGAARQFVIVVFASAVTFGIGAVFGTAIS